jgi:hypothetical protein
MDTQNPTFRRARKVTRTREVPHTVNGVTAMVTQKYTTHIPLPPRDWDRIVRGGVTGATTATVAGSIAWSTASIGDLLATAVHPAIAYGAAGAFDLAWITCMALEWLARYDRRKARAPMIAGYVALGAAMAAIGTHGFLLGGATGKAVGIIGALVSALAKGMWTMTMRHHSVELDDRSQQWVEQRLATAHARLATAAVERELARVEGATADYRAAYAPAIEAGRDDRQRALDYARTFMTDASDDEIDAQLAAAGLDEPVTSPVMSPEQDDHWDDHWDDQQADRRMTTVPAARPARQMVTAAVTPPRKLTGAQLLAAARRLDNQARKQKPSRPVTIGTLRAELGLSRREAGDLRDVIVGKGE